jgi:putative DNA primase/helicase
MICNICGGEPCKTPSFCEVCRKTDGAAPYDYTYAADEPPPAQGPDDYGQTAGDKPREQAERKQHHKQAPKAERKRQNGSEAPTALILDPHDPMQAARTLVAARFVNDDHRLLHRHRGTFWRFQANHYALADQETVRTEVWKFLEQAQRRGEKNGKPVPFKPNRARVSDVLDALASVCNLDSRIDPPAWLDGADDLPAAAAMLALGNGLLHLPSGELYPPTPNHFGLTASDVVFDPDAPDPKHWLAFLDDLFGTDESAIIALQDWFGYALSPDTSQQKILFVVGPRRSGKGTIARVLTSLLGRDSVANPTLASLQTPFGLAPLIGKPLAFITDARLGSRSDQAAITERLLSISGEDALTIDRKFMPAWTGRLSTRFTILTNELPRISDTSGALVGRLVVLVLMQSFYGREDPALTARLLTELPGILNWALHGYRRLRQRGYFVQPASAREAIEDLEVLASPIKAFLNDRCHIKPGITVPVELLYQSWKMWCDGAGRKEHGTKQTFGRDLKATIPSLRTTQPRDGDSRSRSYEGVGLKEDTQP